jgi:hypothetical protein
MAGHGWTERASRAPHERERSSALALTPLVKRRYANSRATTRANVDRLATLSMAAESEDARLLLHEIHAELQSIAELTEMLIEPTARRLGDLWASDDCGECDVTLGLCRLQTMLHELAADSVQDFTPHPLIILVAPLPGEIHMLSASLDAEALWRAGHDARIRFPSTEQALRQLVANDWYDAIDLSLSAAFTREHRLERMSQIIASVRRHSKNPALVVIVGGRAFHDHTAASHNVHGDVCCTSASQLSAEIARLRSPVH